MNVVIEPAPEAAKAVMDNLVQLYLHDFTEFEDDDVDERGRFTMHYLNHYWVEPGRFPFFIRVDGKLAGFALVRDVREPGDAEATHNMAEFFIMRKYRRQRVGKIAAWQIFERFPGRWNVAQVPKNLPAQQFWRKIIGEYTDGAFEETISPEFHGPIQAFRAPRRSIA